MVLKPFAIFIYTFFGLWQRFVLVMTVNENSKNWHLLTLTMRQFMYPTKNVNFMLRTVNTSKFCRRNG